jgi:ABC-2 type transport system ATP-binding protein
MSETASNAAISISGARKVYETRMGLSKRIAVDDVTFEVMPGTIHGLLGPNGAGKTTTLKMLIGLARPTAGDFRILGEPSRSPKGRARLGFLPEQPYFPPQLTGEQAMRLYGRLAAAPETELKSRTAELLATVGLEGRGDSRLSAYSRGMLQRLGVAQALIGDPDVVVLDEPASGLDPVGQRDMRNLMLSLRERGVTVLLSSHQLSEVEAVCDRVTILNRGTVAAEGPLADLLNVHGRTSVRATGLSGGLPKAVAALTDDVAVSGGMSVFSVPDESVRQVVDALDDAGGSIVSITPKRESLEDYFSRLLETASSTGEVAS